MAKGKPKGKSSNKTAAAYTKKKAIDVAKPDGDGQQPMLASDFDESAYLKGTDLTLGEEEEVTIDEVATALLGEEGQQKKKPVLAFREIEKKLILNTTNRSVLQEALGNDMRRWPNHKIVLFPLMVDFRGKQHQAARLRMPGPKGSGGGGGLRRKG